MTEFQLKEKANQEWGNISKLAEAAYCDGYNYAMSFKKEERINIADERDKVIAAHIEGQRLVNDVSNDDEAVLYFEENVEIGRLLKDKNSIISSVVYNSKSGKYTLFHNDNTIKAEISRKEVIEYLKSIQ